MLHTLLESKSYTYDNYNHIFRPTKKATRQPKHQEGSSWAYDKLRSGTSLLFKKPR